MNGYEPRLIAPFVNSGLQKYYKPWIVGLEAFPFIQDAYAWRGSVKKREGMRILGTFPAGDKPVQGLKNYINPSTLNESLIGFSQTKSYLFNNLTNVYTDITFFANPAGTAFSWSNTADDYFWTSNYAGSMWTTNNLTADHIKFWNGTPGSLGVSGGWSTFQPTISGTTRLNAALIILPYKGRLVVLNTTEDSNKFPNRARWSQIGTPYTSNVVGVAIGGITIAANAVITIADTTGFVIGQNAGITGVVGTMGPLLNNNQFTVTAINPGVSITIAANTVGLVYTSGGIVQGPGTTTPPAPFSIDIFAWRDDIPGKGGFNDADTSERIVSAGIVKDTLIVFFQRSTWRLRYTGNEILPFIWERLNTQYGAESTYSNVSFDDAILAFSRFGWIGSDTNDVARIDEAIPDDSFSVESTDSTFVGMTRIQGIRDFYRQFAYWTYPSIGHQFANQIYAYNYLDKTWSIFEPKFPVQNNIKTFGIFHTNADYTWSALNAPGPTPARNSWENFNGPQDIWSQFGTGINANFPYVIGGDALGNTYQMFEFFQSPNSDAGTNFNFNISTARFNPYIKQGQKCRLGFADLYITNLPGGEITLQLFIDDQDTDPVIKKKVVLSDRGAVNITAITTGLPTIITTGQAHGLITGELVTMSGIVGNIGPLLNNLELPVTAIDNFNFSVNVDSTGFVYQNEGLVYSIELPAGNAKYTRVYFNVNAHFHQLVFTLDSDQQADPVKGRSQFELEGIVLWTRPGGRIRG